MKKLLLILLLTFTLTACGESVVTINTDKDRTLIDVGSIHNAVATQCMVETCEENAEFTFSELRIYIQVLTDEVSSGFRESYYEIDDTVVIGKWTSEGIYVYLEATEEAEEVTEMNVLHSITS